MSENFKVNAKTPILEFKRKHNKLVDNIPEAIEQAIQADKDIFSQIEINIYEEEEYTRICFPTGILPISWYDANTGIDDFVFANYEEVDLLNSQGERIDSEISVDTGINGIYIDLHGITNYSKEDMYDLLYIHFDKPDDIAMYRNWYAILNPITESGTKLYKHSFKITNEDTDSVYCELITNSSTEIDTTEKLKSAEIISGRVGINQNVQGIFMGIDESIYYSNQTSISSLYLYGTETFTTDTVTPL